MQQRCIRARSHSTATGGGSNASVAVRAHPAAANWPSIMLVYSSRYLIASHRPGHPARRALAHQLSRSPDAGAAAAGHDHAAAMAAGAGRWEGGTRGWQLGFRWHVTPAISTGRPSLRFSTTAAHVRIPFHDMSSAAERGKGGCDGRLARSGAPARITHRWMGGKHRKGRSDRQPSTATFFECIFAQSPRRHVCGLPLQGRVELQRACVPKGSPAQCPARRADLKKPASLRFAI